MLQPASLGKKGFNYFYQILIACEILIRQSECPVAKIYIFPNKTLHIPM